MQNYLIFVVFALVIGFVIFIFFQQSSILDLFSFQLATSTPATSTPPKIVKPPAPKQVVSPPPSTPSPQESPKPQITPPAGFTLDQISPYYQKVRISSVVRARRSGDVGKIKFSASSIKDESINLTNWRIKTNSGALIIPQAINKYDPFGYAEAGNVILGSGDYLHLYSSKSLPGRNFRLNKCTGYLNNIYTFDPALPKQCPRVDRQSISSFSGQCQSFILSLRTCQEPTSNEINKFVSPLNQSCNELLRTLNYRGCYDRHNQDDDFLLREWRVWLNKALPLDSQHDRLLLFDEEGLLVDEYTY